MDRRIFLKNTLLASAAVALRPSSLLAAGVKGRADAADIAALEHQHGGRLGVAILDTHSGRRIAYRADERFLLCSTFKLLLAASVLDRVDHGTVQLDRRFVVHHSDLLDYAPITSHHVGPPGMTLAELCKAAITLSDNTAANVLMAHLGGPRSVTAYARRLGDTKTRLDHMEPDLNRPSPNGVSDTTTPGAMLANLQTLLLGHALSDASRAQLITWLRGTVTGKKLLRAGLPADWQVGEKTGSGDTETNDVAIIWPPARQPILVAAYYQNATADSDGRSRVLAEVGRIVGLL